MIMQVAIDFGFSCFNSLLSGMKHHKMLIGYNLSIRTDFCIFKTRLYRTGCFGLR
jgi:hypothetical protein